MAHAPIDAPSRARLGALTSNPQCPEKYARILEHFYEEYWAAAAEGGHAEAVVDELWCTLVDRLQDQLTSPFAFAPFHRRITAPFDYYAFGLEFLRPIVDFERSTLQGEAALDRIAAQLDAGENVFLLANHQTEGDPQAISLLLERTHPQLGKEMVFVAGERVLTDPLAVPFGMGRNLLCIYSKRYIDHPPERKADKQRHNQRTMERMRELLGSGGQCIYAAPAGGRDRSRPDGTVEIAAFDPASIEMYYLMARRARRPSHFYPMALATYDLIPPPAGIQIELGEERRIRRAPIHLAIGSEIDMEGFPNAPVDKHARRAARAQHIWESVRDAHERLTQRRSRSAMR